MATAPPRTLHTTNGFQRRTGQLSYQRRHTGNTSQGSSKTEMQGVTTSERTLEHPKSAHKKITYTFSRNVAAAERPQLSLSPMIPFDRLSMLFFLCHVAGNISTDDGQIENFIRLFVVRSSTSCAVSFLRMAWPTFQFLLKSTMTGCALLRWLEIGKYCT